MPSLRLVESEPGQSRYGALAAAMRSRIIAGEWPPGSAIPAEQALAAEHGVALGTMRRALDLLAEQGLVERSHGRGTFVRQGLSGATMLRFFRFGAAGEQAPQSRILAREALAAPAEVARVLAIGPGEQALRLKRLRTVGGQPALLEEIWLPLPLFAPLTGGDPAGWGDLLYPFYAERCGVHVQRAVDTIGFGRLGAVQARALRLAAGHPCARVQRQAFDLAGRCVEWRTTLGDANAFHYTVAIT
ncbi:Transcriptional regulator, GntR family [Rubrivivax sp. A210]|uniref:GntR family transcriptional regulator n=1 Tax=Rubrivivax sp. A210 TaxID=2772301 RepID=UPI001918882E|nr:GntR family transcriptional regulator [Rubrivivax sp. A210]CAD5372956.1 Transcriptional regulator, GntR family [Rubrivivax sp. A210]